MKISLSTFLLLLPLLLINSFVSSSPIYAIVSTPSDFPDQYDPNKYSYVKESFSQFITVAGGTPVYVPYDLSDSELFPILDVVDGVLFVGGDAIYWTEDPNSGQREFTYFVTQIQKILQYVQDQNNKGRYMPLVGICQGMEVAIMALTDSPYLLDTYVDANTHGRLNVTEEGRQSRMFGWVQDKQAEYLAANGTLFFNHMFGYNLSSLNGYEDVKESITLTGIAEDRNDKIFMAAIEAKSWPMYIMMFHPEKVLWEQQMSNYSHTPEVMSFVLNLAVFFVEEAKIGGLNEVPKDVLDNWYFSQYEPIDVEALMPKVYISKGSQIINNKKPSNVLRMKRKAKAKLISKEFY